MPTKYNPNISSLEEVDRAFNEKINDYHRTVKTIGLLNIFSSGGFIMGEISSSNILGTDCDIANAITSIKNLDTKKTNTFPLTWPTITFA